MSVRPVADTTSDAPCHAGWQEIHIIATLALLQVKPTHILNAAGLTGRPNVDWCEDHKVWAPGLSRSMSFKACVI